MATDVGGMITGMGSSIGGGITTMLYIVAIIIFGGGALALLIWWVTKRKRWNLDVELKLVRSDGTITLGEWARGSYNAKRGVVYIKRKKMFRPYEMKVFDIRRYLQGASLLTAIQVGPEDIRPVLNKSWVSHIVEYTDKKTGERKTVHESILNIKVDSGENKAWRVAFEEAAAQAYSLKSFIQQFQVPITVAIVIISIFCGFAIIWGKIPTCG